jgi:cell volume regulation protein A
VTHSEPQLTALFLAAGGLLLAACVLLSRASGRIGVPVALIFLSIGMLAGREGIGGITFADYRLAFRFGTAALALILFDGGLNTPLSAFREALGPSSVLASLGVAGTAGMMALGAHALGFTWAEALLLGAVVSSTDAATIFAVLRTSGIHLKRRVGMTVELESGLNDPIAVILTIGLTEALKRGTYSLPHMLLDIAIQAGVGAALGVGLGYAARWVLSISRLPVGGLYPILTSALAALAFGIPSLLEGSGFLAVYLAGVILGNSAFPFRTSVLRVHDSIAWFGQVTMFLLLGLLVSPSHLPVVVVPSVVLALFLALVARPLVVWLCLLPFRRFTWRERLFIGWMGLRGAVPIILATFPVLERVRSGERLFEIVFFVVVVNALIPGATVRWATRKLGVGLPVTPHPAALLEITTTQSLQGAVVSFYIGGASSVCNASLADIPFPEGAAAMLIVRGHDLVAARGPTVLQAGDHVYVFCRPEDRAFIDLLFGAEEE